jgi:hypothetical protein
VGRLYGNEYWINSEMSFFKIFFDLGQNNNHFVITMDCGEPDTSTIKSTIIIQSFDVAFVLPLPDYAKNWTDLCVTGLFTQVTNDPLPEYISLGVLD